jgi:urea ABC transporter permease protein UrtC
MGRLRRGASSRAMTRGRMETLLAAVVFVAICVIPYFVAGYIIYILPQYMTFGIMAMAVGLLWGFVGILSFGHAAFFALGAYALGILVRDLGLAGAGEIGLLAAPVLGFLLAAVIGYFLFSGGVRDTYFVLVTLAIAVIFEVLANSQSELTGGFNGLNISPVSIAGVSFQGEYRLYYLILAVTVVIYVLLRVLMASRFGKVLVGIRESEDRTQALGFNTALYKTMAFGLSGALAAFAGALYAAHAQFVAPSLGGVVFSTEVVIWVAVGGRGYLLGAFLGALALASLSNFLSERFPEYWQLVLGVLFVLVIIYFKEGLLGVLGRRSEQAQEAR